MRVFELAKKVGVISKKLIPELKALGADIKNHMSVIDDSYAQAIVSQYAGGKAPGRHGQPLSRGRVMVLLKKEKPKEEVESLPAVQEQVADDTGVAMEAETVAVEKTEMAEVDVEPVLEVPGGVEKTTEDLKTEPVEEKTAVIDKKAPLAVEKEKVLPKKPEKEEISKPSTAKLLELKKKFSQNAALTKPADKKKRGDKSFKNLTAGDFYDYRKTSKKWRPKHGASHKYAASGNMSSTIKRKKTVKFNEGASIKEFAEVIGRKASEIIKKLMETGTMITANQSLDRDAALFVAEEFDIKLEVIDTVTENDILGIVEDSAASLVTRSPVVTIMGHVDHGKTSLLDVIRNTKVADLEAGGITQHIGAYKISHNDREVTFLDTPGHEAFTSMRARGANLTDIVLLLVAADDGVMPQTVEAINHAKAAEASIIVVINKIDKPDANPTRVKTQFMDHGIIVEDMGGDTIFCEISAKKKIGIDQLLEMILLEADMMELKANPDRLADGVIIEAQLHRSRGAVASVLVQRGTLRIGDAFVVGRYEGKVRTLTNDLGERIAEAGPSTPVEVTGLTGVPLAGDSFVVVEDEKNAKLIAERREIKWRKDQQVVSPKITLDNLFEELKGADQKELKIIIKADVQGSAEALKDSLLKLPSDKVITKVIHMGVGGITETDVNLAAASNAIIVGFNIRPEPQAKVLAEAEGVDLRLYTVIYKALEDVVKAMEGLLEPQLEDHVLGRLEVRSLFTASKVGTIAGSYVLDGSINRNCSGVRIIRDNVLIYDAKLVSLKRFKDDVKEVTVGYECGVVLDYGDLKTGDILEAYNQIEVATKL